VAGVDVEEAGVGMAVVEDVDADVDADAGSDGILMLSSCSLCSDVFDSKNDRTRCNSIIFVIVTVRIPEVVNVGQDTIQHPTANATNTLCRALLMNR
jgi:hypothetical protein